MSVFFWGEHKLPNPTNALGHLCLEVLSKLTRHVKPVFFGKMFQTVAFREKENITACVKGHGQTDKFKKKFQLPTT